MPSQHQHQRPILMTTTSRPKQPQQASLKTPSSISIPVSNIDTQHQPRYASSTPTPRIDVNLHHLQQHPTNLELCTIDSDIRPIRKHQSSAVWPMLFVAQTPKERTGQTSYAVQALIPRMSHSQTLFQENPALVWTVSKHCVLEYSPRVRASIVQWSLHMDYWKTFLCIPESSRRSFATIQRRASHDSSVKRRKRLNTMNGK